MSINPASASEPVMRETDSSSNRNWSPLQGSRTGSKEGQFSSFWDNAFRGAQKLFGLEKTSQETEPKEEDRSGDNRREVAKSRDGLNTISGFGGSRFGLSLSMGRDSMGNLPRFGRIENARPEPVEAQQPIRNERSESPESEVGDRTERFAPPKEATERKPISEDEPKAKVEDEVIDEEDEKSAKTAVRTQALVQGSSALSSDKILTSDSQQVTNNSSPVGIENAKLSGNMLNASPDQEKTAVSQQVRSAAPADRGEVASQIEKVATEPLSRPHGKIVDIPTVSSAKEISNPLPVEGSQQTKPNAEAAKPVSKEPVVAANVKPVAQTNVQVATSSKPVAGPDVQGAKVEMPTPVQNKEPIIETPKSKTPSESVLSFDAEKAKAEVSSALQRQANGIQSRSPQSSAKAPQAPAANANSLSEGTAKSVDTAQVEAPETSSNLNEAKTKGQDIGSRIAAAARQRRTDAPVNPDQARSQTAPNASQTASEHANANSRVANPEKLESNAANLRDMPRPDLANRVQGPRISNTPNSQSNGISSTATTASISGVSESAGSQSSSHHQGSENAPKQDIASAIKLAVSNIRSEKGGDSNQSFNVQSANASQSRRSQAAVKSQPASYVSKTVDEVKEVIATLTKSIDRLSATRQDTISVKVNFDGGGSLALKVSMENGQVKAAMQTDVPGLEAMLKGSWNDLVNEVAQKGIKLNQPQFSQSEGESRNENFTSNDQRGERSNSSEANTSRGQNRSGSGNTGNRRASAGEVIGESNEQSPSADDSSIVSDNELKTYA